MGRSNIRRPGPFWGPCRARLLVSLFLYLLCGAAMFIPSISMGGTNALFGVEEQHTFSMFFVFDVGGFGGVVIGQLVIYALGLITLLVSFASNPVKVWGILVAIVFSVFFFGANAFWISLFAPAAVSAGGYFKLDVVGWIYVVVQLAHIIHMITLVVQIKKRK